MADPSSVIPILQDIGEHLQQAGRTWQDTLETVEQRTRSLLQQVEKKEQGLKASSYRTQLKDARLELERSRQRYHAQEVALQDLIEKEVREAQRWLAAGQEFLGEYGRCPVAGSSASARLTFAEAMPPAVMLTALQAAMPFTEEDSYANRTIGKGNQAEKFVEQMAGKMGWHGVSFQHTYQGIDCIFEDNRGRLIVVEVKFNKQSSRLVLSRTKDKVLQNTVRAVVKRAKKMLRNPANAEQATLARRLLAEINDDPEVNRVDRWCFTFHPMTKGITKGILITPYIGGEGEKWIKQPGFYTHEILPEGEPFILPEVLAAQIYQWVGDGLRNGDAQ